MDKCNNYSITNSFIIRFTLPLLHHIKQVKQLRLACFFIACCGGDKGRQP